MPVSRILFSPFFFFLLYFLSLSWRKDFLGIARLTYYDWGVREIYRKAVGYRTAGLAGYIQERTLM